MLYKAHIKKAQDKAESMGIQLARLMPNIGGPREGRGRLFTSVVQSVLLYGAPTWAQSLRYDPGNAKLLNKGECCSVAFVPIAPSQRSL